MTTDALENVLEELAQLAAEVVRTANRKLSYKSSLKALNKKLAGMHDAVDSETARKRAFDEFELYKTSRDPKVVSARSVRILAGTSEICGTSDFCHLVEMMMPLTSNQLIRTLFASYIINFASRQHLALHALVEQALQGYQGSNERILFWRQNSSLLVGDEAPSKMGALMARELMPLHEMSKRFNLPLANTRFAVLCLGMASMLGAQRFAKSSTPDRKVWDFVFSCLSSPSMLTQARCRTLESLIEGVDSKTRDNEWDAFKQDLKDYCVQKLGDPRANAIRWQGISQKARDAFIAWLSEEDLALFFEIIIRDDPHRRKPFWQQYLRSIRRSRVIVGDSDRISCRKKLVDLEAKGRSFAVGEGIDTSAFFLDFGKYVVVEFSMVGNACYVYKSTDFHKLFPSFFAETVHLPSLKNQQLAEYRQPHTSGWWHNLRNKLADLGIRKDSEPNFSY